MIVYDLCTKFTAHFNEVHLTEQHEKTSADYIYKFDTETLKGTSELYGQMLHRFFSRKVIEWEFDNLKNILFITLEAETERENE